ncbi:glycosyl transferase [Piscinibacter sakaiensis]|uniref:glycosyl transferase n=1 Tax=Piscinibacter sakaiensis TaxID=1547922 RepID=UPI003AAF3730
MTKKKILAVASGGGHWVQMCRLRPALEGLDVTFVSVSADYAEDVPGSDFLAVRDVNRWDRFGFVILACQFLRIFWRVRPDVVMTTGAAPGLVALLLAKLLFRKKTMWIDSLANCEKVSGSGMLARHVADVWLTQWPHLKDGRKPDYWGAIL